MAGLTLRWSSSGGGVTRGVVCSGGGSRGIDNQKPGVAGPAAGGLHELALLPAGPQDGGPHSTVLTARGRAAAHQAAQHPSGAQSAPAHGERRPPGAGTCVPCAPCRTHASAWLRPGALARASMTAVLAVVGTLRSRRVACRGPSRAIEMADQLVHGWWPAVPLARGAAAPAGHRQTHVQVVGPSQALALLGLAWLGLAWLGLAWLGGQ
jgi:hypothetical protein